MKPEFTMALLGLLSCTVFANDNERMVACQTSVGVTAGTPAARLGHELKEYGLEQWAEFITTKLMPRIHRLQAMRAADGVTLVGTEGFKYCMANAPNWVPQEPLPAERTVR